MDRSWSSLTGLCAAIALGISFATPQAAAADLDGGERATKSTTVFWGVNVREHAWLTYLGGVHAFNQDLRSDGLLVRLFGTFGEYDYNAGGIGKVDVDALSGDAMLGYQFYTDIARLTLYAGVNVQDRDLSPNNPASSVKGTDTGFKVQGEARTLASSPLFVSLLGSYSTANDSYYSRGRLGFNLGEIVVGPEGVVLGNDAFDGYRVGGFVGGIQLGPINTTLSVGYADSDGNGGRNGVYGSLGFGTQF